MAILKIEGGALYQWDTGRRVEVTPPRNCTVDEVQFMNPDGDAAYVVGLETEDSRIFAPIPNILLQSSENITAFAVMHTADGGERTICDCIFGVRSRQKSSDYVYDEILLHGDEVAY